MHVEEGLYIVALVFVLHRRKKAWLMLKLKNVYPYGLYDRIEDKDHLKSRKEYAHLTGYTFLSVPRK